MVARMARQRAECMSVATQDSEKALQAKRKELLKCSEAEAALANPAIMDYFNSVREQAVEAMLNPAFDADEQTLWRLRATAQTVDKLFNYLESERDLRAFIEEEIKALEG